MLRNADPDHNSIDTREDDVGVGDRGSAETRTRSVADPTNTLLLFAADYVDDLEKTRIATDNRLRALEQIKGVDTSGGLAAELALSAQVFKEREEAAIKHLQRVMRSHPLGPFVKRSVGVGEKQAARLLAAIGDPATRPEYSDVEIDGEVVRAPTGVLLDRTVSQLWAYCGLHVKDGKRPKRKAGEKANWSNVAKMRARLIAESCLKHRCKECTIAAKAEAELLGKATPWSPPPPNCSCDANGRERYRAVYDAEREKWSTRDVTDGHAHNHALGIVAKHVLRDLWVEARILRGHATTETPLQVAA